MSFLFTHLTLSNRVSWRIGAALCCSIPGLMMSPTLIFQAVSASLDFSTPKLYNLGLKDPFS